MSAPRTLGAGATAPPLLILGCGFTGMEAARQALASGQVVAGTSRAVEKLGELRALGIHAEWAPELNADAVHARLLPGARVLVTFAPDGVTDAKVAPALAGHRIVYISTTGVFGGARGKVDESTPVDATNPRAAARLAAEALYQQQGAVVLRAAGIYGPWRGLHRRLLAGTYRIPAAGSNVVSRIHVADLAALARSVLDAGDEIFARTRGRAFVVADDAPVPQIEALEWLCHELGVALPPSSPLDEVPVTLRHDRAVDNRAIKALLRFQLAYPSYREGFAACLRAERAQESALK